MVQVPLEYIMTENRKVNIALEQDCKSRTFSVLCECYLPLDVILFWFTIFIGAGEMQFQGLYLAFPTTIALPLQTKEQCGDSVNC